MKPAAGVGLLAVLLCACAPTPIAEPEREPEPEPEYWGLADLVIRAFIPPVIFAGEGDTIYVSHLVENIGTNVSTDTRVRYYIAQDAVVDVTRATVLGEKALPSLAPGQHDESMEQPFVIPAGVGQPPLFLAACVDVDGDVDEIHDDNNCTTDGAGFLQFDGGKGYGQVKLALMNEILGRSSWAPSVFGCQAPDSGNAEIIAHYGTDEQKAQYLQPLLDGELSTTYSMTEPQAGSDPNEFTCRAHQDGDEWVINGEKWFASNYRYASFLFLPCRRALAETLPFVLLLLAFVVLLLLAVQTTRNASLGGKRLAFEGIGINIVIVMEVVVAREGSHGP